MTLEDKAKLLAELEQVAISPTVQFQHSYDRELLGGVTVLQGQAHVLAGDRWEDKLYRKISPQETKTIDIRLVPYYTWGNRGHSEMTVWIPLR